MTKDLFIHDSRDFAEEVGRANSSILRSIRRLRGRKIEKKEYDANFREEKYFIPNNRRPYPYMLMTDVGLQLAKDYLKDYRSLCETMK